MFAIERLADDDKSLWNEWLSSNSDASFYHLWEWGDVLCKTYGYARYYVVAKDGEDVLGVFPLLYVKSLIFGKRLISLPFVEYAGPILKNGLSSSEAKLVLTQLMDYIANLKSKLKADYVEVRQPPRLLSSLLPSFGFTAVQRHVTFRIDLTKGESELWKGMKKKARNSLRKAVKAGVEIDEVEEEGLKPYYDLYLDAQKRHGSPPHSFDFFLNIYDAFRSAGLLRMTLAVYDNRPIAGVLVFCFRDTLYWFGNVVHRKYAKLNPTNLLLWNTMEFGMKHNFRVFDLGQTRKEESGVYRFKAGWGGNEANLEDYIFSPGNVELPNPDARKYVLLSKIWSKLPRSLARRLGPRIIAGIAL
jgi:FemAB-related protein (PEP-CTERM system-associated)